MEQHYQYKAIHDEDGKMTGYKKIKIDTYTIFRKDGKTNSLYKEITSDDADKSWGVTIGSETGGHYSNAEKDEYIKYVLKMGLSVFLNGKQI